MNRRRRLSQTLRIQVLGLLILFCQKLLESFCLSLSDAVFPLGGDFHRQHEYYPRLCKSMTTIPLGSSVCLSRWKK